jgi:hypothetical protein
MGRADAQRLDGTVSLADGELGGFAIEGPTKRLNPAVSRSGNDCYVRQAAD